MASAMLGVAGWKVLGGKVLYGLGCAVAAAVLFVSGAAYYGTSAVNNLGTSLASGQ